MDLGGAYGPGSVNAQNGVAKSLPYALNISGYQNLEMDIANIGNGTNQWDQYNQIQGIRPMLQVNVSGTPTYEQAQANGQAYSITLYATPTPTNFMHFVIPLSDWSGYNLSTATGIGIDVYDANNNGAVIYLDVGFANIKLSGAPAWAPVFSNLTSPSMAIGTPSVTLTGRVSGVVAGTNVYCWQGTPVSVTINGNTQTTSISDATGDFSINYTGTGSLPIGSYPITYSVPADMVALVGATNNATSLTVVITLPPPAPHIGVSRSGNNLVLTVPNSASGHSYYLLTTTNLNPPVVWTTNSTTGGTGGTITNMVPITSGTPKQFFRYLVQ